MNYEFNLATMVLSAAILHYLVSLSLSLSLFLSLALFFLFALENLHDIRITYLIASFPVYLRHTSPISTS